MENEQRVVEVKISRREKELVSYGRFAKHWIFVALDS